MLRTIIPLAFLTVACGSGDGSPLLGGDPVGRWRELPNAADPEPPPVEQRDLLEFAADGTFIARTGAGVESTGTWDSYDGLLVITEDGDASVGVPYHASADRLLLVALVPAGAVEGVIGTWTATADGVEEGQPSTVVTTLVLRSDNTASMRFDRELGEDEAFDATWSNVGSDFRIEFLPSENFIFDLNLSLVDGVLGSPYERL